MRRGSGVSPCATSGARHSVVTSMNAHSKSRWFDSTPRFIATMNASDSAARGSMSCASARELRTRENMYTLMPRKTALITSRNSIEVGSRTK